jgi:hypothetical protein
MRFMLPSCNDPTEKLRSLTIVSVFACEKLNPNDMMHKILKENCE